MTTKTKTITLSYPHSSFKVDQHISNNDPLRPLRDNEMFYRVENVTDSTEFNPTQYLRKSTVDELCEAKGWKVSTKPRN